VLNYHYKSNLSVQFYRLKEEYGFTEAKKKMISILSNVMEKELPMFSDNIDTMILLTKIETIINDTLLALKSKHDYNRLMNIPKDSIIK
jgi:hypothetical protein